MFFDLDGLKAVNDSLGHLAGDAFIRALATTIAHETRDADVSARLGGDEFVLLLFSATLSDAQVVGRRIEEAFERGGEGFPGTFSVGIAERVPGGTETLDDLLARADRLMYEAKMRRRFTRRD
jgi:diguanylate cyclase (GGDEF)-like protein